MTEDFEIDALAYLLEEMEPARRAAFEAMLARDPAAQRALKACADALAGFAADAAPAAPMAPADQQAALATILAVANQSTPSVAPSRSVIWWSRVVWPMAAALLLGLNLYQWNRSAPGIAPTQSRSPSSGTADRPLQARSAMAEMADVPPAVVEADAVPPVENGFSRRDGAAPERSRRARPADEARQIEQLRREYAELQRTNETLRADYAGVLHQLAERAVVEKSVSRLATMELVDAASYARGDRRGLTEVARTLLTEPGLVVAETSNSEKPPVPDDTVGTAIKTDPVNTGGSKAATDVPVPYAWSVFDDKENRGFLNLYNLPKLAADQSLQLWVKTVDGTAYQRVGEVPAQFQGGSGSVSYNLPEASLAPAEILVTQEPRATVGAQPTGAVVLRGP